MNCDDNPRCCVFSLSILYSVSRPITSFDNQKNTEDTARQNYYPHFIDGETETQGQKGKKS